MNWYPSDQLLQHGATGHAMSDQNWIIQFWLKPFAGIYSGEMMSHAPQNLIIQFCQAITNQHTGLTRNDKLSKKGLPNVQPPFSIL